MADRKGFLIVIGLMLLIFVASLISDDYHKKQEVDVYATFAAEDAKHLYLVDAIKEGIYKVNIQTTYVSSAGVLQEYAIPQNKVGEMKVGYDAILLELDDVKLVIAHPDYLEVGQTYSAFSEGIRVGSFKNGLDLWGEEFHCPSRGQYTLIKNADNQFRVDFKLTCEDERQSIEGSWAFQVLEG